ncbi:MAG: M1 family metallopeptidase [Algibacter sp.]|uniref:M1 family metallopeptidase n=1 Tax=Algibacter sp. TaxID=1872428 RepID=UPI003297F379
MKWIVLVLCFCAHLLGAQQTHYVDFKEVKTVLAFNQMKVDTTVFNSYEIKFDVLKQTDSVYLDAIDMKFSSVELNKSTVKFKNDGKKLIIYNPFEASKTYTLSFLFLASPKKAIYFIGWDNKENITSGYSDKNRNSIEKKQIWTQGQGKYTSHWLPSIDDMNDKIEFDISCIAPKGFEVISNGKMVSKKEEPSFNLWEFDMQSPMSSYLAALVIGKYSKNVEYSKSSIPLEMYYYPEDSLKFEPTYRYTKQMFDFLEGEIGVPYPWQNYKQVPVKDFLYAGMENTSTTIFADSFVIDSIAFVDKNYVNVNAHELAHQWFGDLVTETSGTHHWLQEGFATYYALLAERDIFGDNYYYWRLYEYAQELLEQDKAGGSTSLLDPKSSSTTFYKKGAWVLHLLRERIGDKVFKTAVKTYLNAYKYKNVETDNFIKEVEIASGEDLSDFVDFWLKAETFNYHEVLKSLKKSSFIQEYLMVDCEAFTSKCSDYLASGISDEAKIKVISQIPNHLKKENFKNSVKVRQAIARNISNIPSELKTEYESLLDDASYITIETALFNLWQNFPSERTNYLEKTKHIQGFNDKNVRILWLTLALISDDFQLENNSKYFDELTSYTNPEYGFEIRQNAFQYLHQIQACNAVCKENLKQATTHHNWRFKKFAKELLKAN